MTSFVRLRRIAHKKFKVLLNGNDCKVCFWFVFFQPAFRHLAMKKELHHPKFQLQRLQNFLEVTWQRTVLCMVLHRGVAMEMHPILNTYSLTLGKWLQLAA